MHCANSGVPDLARLGRTPDAWRPEILAAFGHGFPNVDSYRLRLLLHCGVTESTRHPPPVRA